MLGPVQLHDGTRSVPSRSGMLRTLLALLSLRPTESTPVDAVIEELWGAHFPEDPRRRSRCRCPGCGDGCALREPTAHS